MLSHVRCFLTPWTVVYVSSFSIHGTSQAWILEWTAISYPRRSSWPSDWALVSCIFYIGKQILYHQCHLGKWKWKLLSCVWLFVTWNSPDKNIGMGPLSLLQGIFPAQGSNPGLPGFKSAGEFFTSWATREAQCHPGKRKSQRYLHTLSSLSFRFSSNDILQVK